MNATERRSAPRIAVVMGSKSDYEVMKETCNVLNGFKVSYEARVISAHRTPDLAHDYATKAEGRGFQVIIAAAGKSAHLAGVIAALIPLPVIGVPMATSDLGGLDSLLSMVQMPAGVPVATVTIGKSGARNAALLAITILSLSDPELKAKLRDYRNQMRLEVEAADAEIRGEMVAK